ncbi:MAG TPA: thioredoxin [Solirubrobacterales bacterium]|nr:thioredoxin [Solirubrobacterales bacterium]
MAFDVDEAQFEQRVIERSRELPVVVDFWAEWCGPCRTLSPALEAAAAKREGKVELAKLDTDRNQQLAAAFGIRGIPAVKAFRDGRVTDEFTGAIPPAQVEQFFDSLVPSPADELAATGDEESLRRALELDRRHVDAARRLGRLLLERGDAAEAHQVLEPFEGDFLAEGLTARARLSGEDGDGAAEDRGGLSAAFAAWDEGDHETALAALEGALTDADDPQPRDDIRRVMVAIFTELGADHPLAREYRRRLAAALN